MKIKDKEKKCNRRQSKKNTYMGTRIRMNDFHKKKMRSKKRNILF